MFNSVRFGSVSEKISRGNGTQKTGEEHTEYFDSNFIVFVKNHGFGTQNSYIC
jgi:hypothetical protein